MDLDPGWEQGQFLAQTVALIMYAVAAANGRGHHTRSIVHGLAVLYSVGLDGRPAYPEFQESLSMPMFCLPRAELPVLGEGQCCLTLSHRSLSPAA